MKIKAMLKYIRNRLLYRYKCDSETYIKHLRSLGMKIGERTTIFSPPHTIIDETRPWMIEIGDDVQITDGVTILTHGYDWSVLKKLYDVVLGSSGGVYIGDNVFIGMHSTILMGTHIGSNVIIGANSLVNTDIPDNCVAAGNPCRVLMGIEEYYAKRQMKQMQEATELVQRYRSVYGKEPGEHALREHFWLFSNDPDCLPKEWEHVNSLTGNQQSSEEAMRKHKTEYRSMDEFLRHIP